MKGDFSRFDVEAAQLGAEFVASCIDVSPEALSGMVYDTLDKKLYFNIVRVLIEDQYPSFRKSGLGKRLETLIAESWEMAKEGGRHSFLALGFRTPAVLVGIGAPIHIFLPDVARALGSTSVTPENAGVANALGAILGNVSATSEIVIKPQYSIEGIEGYIVFGKSRNSYVKDKNEAVEIGLCEAEEAAKKEALNRGALGEITITSKVVMNAAEASNKTEVLFGITVVAVAIGGVGL